MPHVCHPRTVFRDEPDYILKESASLPNRGTLSSSQQRTLEQTTAPWSTYLDGAPSRATVFGLYWPPGEPCQSWRNEAYGMAEVVRETGGFGGSICQEDISTTLRAIAGAIIGLSANTSLRGAAVGPTLQLERVDVSKGTVDRVPRSRTDGFDYDPVTGRLHFEGTSHLPEKSDRLIIPYRRWK